MIAVEAPIGFIPLQDATRIVGQKMGGDADIERAIAERCEAGEIAAAYRTLYGAEPLDPAVWRMPHWRNYFADGIIELILPLLDERGQPNVNGFTARCPREIFVRRDSLDRFIASIEPASKPAARRTSPEQARALKAMTAVYGRIPPQNEVSNSMLEQAVNKYLKQESLKAVKRDAVLRAAGRRHN